MPPHATPWLRACSMDLLRDYPPGKFRSSETTGSAYISTYSLISLLNLSSSFLIFAPIKDRKFNLPQSKLFQVRRALVESHLRYGNLIWGHLCATKLHTLQKLKDRAIALTQSATIKDRIPSATLSVNGLIKLDQAVIVHKILNEQCPEILKQKFTERSRVSKYETRRVNDLQVPRSRLEITRKSFSYKGAKVWNDIPKNIRNVESAALFKKQVRNYKMARLVLLNTFYWLSSSRVPRLLSRHTAHSRFLFFVSCDQKQIPNMLDLKTQSLAIKIVSFKLLHTADFLD